MERILAYFNRHPGIADKYLTGVSLHSHTQLSQENGLSLGQHLMAFGPSADLVRKAHERCGGMTLEEDLSCMWWTPPLAPRQALDVEARQIEDRLGLAPIVSLSDHDSIDAPMQLQALGRCGAIPVSVEWTVPFRDTYFHEGIHNLPSCRAEAGMEEMARYTAAARARALPEMMASFHGDPECLIVLNHPFWDQPKIGEGLHEARLLEVVDRFRPWIHALEINGLRDWRENRLTIALSKRCAVPLISGGDRHGREPNATLNLTNATTFGEIAREVRRGRSQVVLIPQYRGPLGLRIIENFTAIVSEAPDHGLGWTHWTQRVFRRCDDGHVRSLHTMCKAKPPMTLRAVTSTFRMLSHRRIRPALGWAMPQSRELV